MPSSLRSIIKKYNYQGKLTEEETNDLLKKLDNHDKELIKEFDKELRNRIKIFYNDDDGFIMKQCEFDMLLKSIAEEYGIGEE